MCFPPKYLTTQRNRHARLTHWSFLYLITSHNYSCSRVPALLGQRANCEVLRIRSRWGFCTTDFERPSCTWACRGVLNPIKAWSSFHFIFRTCCGGRSCREFLGTVISAGTHFGSWDNRTWAFQIEHTSWYHWYQYLIIQWKAYLIWPEQEPT